MNKSKTKRYIVTTIKNGKRLNNHIQFGKNRESVEESVRTNYKIPQDVTLEVVQAQWDYVRTKNATGVQKGTSVRRINKKRTAKGKQQISEAKYKADKLKKYKK
jgi:hypothetical protein